MTDKLFQDREISNTDKAYMPLCLVCRSADLDILYQGVRDHYGISQRGYQYWKCKDCASATLYPLPSQEELNSFYPPYYTFKGNPPGGVLRRALSFIEERLFYNPIYNHRVKSLIKYTGLRPGSRVLEVGCGSGILLKKLAARGYQVEGLEVSQEDIRYVEENYGIKVFNGSLAEANFSEESFDAVTLYYILEHLLNPRDTVKEVFRTLKPGGWIVIGVPMIEGLQAAWFRERWGQITEAPRHLFIPSVKGIVGLLKDTGFSKVSKGPISIFDLAGLITTSLMPMASSPLAYGQLSDWKMILRRFLGGLITLLVSPVALAERISYLSRGHPTSSMMFFGKK